MLEIVHLVESSRHHLFNLDRLTSGEGSVPREFQSGIDFIGADLDAHWRIMASLIEFEAFLSACKRCLDHAWCCLGERRGPKASKVATLGKAINKTTGAEDVPYFLHLRKAWTEWGRDLADLRNYVEHHAPLGGRSFGVIRQTEQGEAIEIFIPDKVPGWKETAPKRALTFDKQLTANAYARQIMSIPRTCA